MNYPDSSAAFLKIATAAPDFENLDSEGIPDDFSGPTFVNKTFEYFTVNAPAGKVTYYLMTPTANIAYSTVSYDLDSTGNIPFSDDSKVMPILNWKPTYFTETLSLFAGNQNEDNNTTEVSSGRLMASSAELVSLNNSFTQYGSVATLKTPLKRTPLEDNKLDSLLRWHITGARSLLLPGLGTGCNLTPVRDGSYAVAMNREAEFNFYDVVDGETSDSETSGLQTADRYCQFEGCAPIWDNGYDSICFRVVVPKATTDQAFVLKVWRAWELQPVLNSFVATLAHSSPPLDPRALRLYHELARNLPVSVPVKDNPDFWTTMLDVINTTSEVFGGLPRVGPAIRGVHGIASLVDRAVKGLRAKRQNRNKKTKKKTFPNKKGAKSRRR